MHTTQVSADGLPPRLTWRRGQVAHALGMSEPLFSRKQAELERAGFPRRLPGLKVWSIAAITDWIGCNGGTYRLHGAPATPDSAVAGVAEDLEREYGDADAVREVA